MARKKKLIYVCPRCGSSESYTVAMNKPALPRLRIYDGRCEKNSNRLCFGEFRETQYLEEDSDDQAD
jgi:hypothetical protein